jgi:RecQ family ATP-dependent DNA helicase
MTGQWESYLKQIQRGSAQLQPFMDGIEQYVRDVVAKVGTTKAPARQSAPAHAPEPEPRKPVRPQPSGNPHDILQQGFGFSSFRANQEAVCRSVIEGKDVLLVMPTGSGKSLCYQLPGIARGGTTLVITPLIALMEDQVSKLEERGFSVGRIHSGRDRAASRQTCFDYLNGTLQFLFIAPERLRVSGFPEMLAKRKPSLIAIDEAHCISQWGHDFRPDYRMLGRHLPGFRPAPVIALTATATALVQNDIADQLGLAQATRYVHGFRRSNIAIENVEVGPSQRASLVQELLAEPERRPAIVYAPTRKQVAYLADLLNGIAPTAAYHAGLDADHRKRAQEKFLTGSVEVMVATIAFGMGIDKPDVRTVIHTALPGSLEGYYQEIGRAGRDGEPSRAILMHSYADRYTHDFFFERDYPDVQMLDRVFELLHSRPQSKAELQRRLRLDPDIFDKALEKLWIHGGAGLDFAESATRGHERWRESYIAHGAQKQEQIDQMMRFAEGSHCRMATLVRHFGDLADSSKACGICDFCSPDTCSAQRFRKANAQEKSAMFSVVAALLPGNVKTTGRLHAELFPHGEMSRDSFEELLAAMNRAGLLRLTDAVFEKDGKQIPYRKASLLPAAASLDETTGIDLMIKAAMPTRVKSKRKKTVAAKTKRKKTPGAASISAPGIEDKLRAWRLAEAKRRGVPAFRIFTDQVLRALVSERPSSAEELLSISGIGMNTVEKYGADLSRILREG